jgi:LCP family protein required for cell wall assembly
MNVRRYLHSARYKGSENPRWQRLLGRAIVVLIYGFAGFVAWSVAISGLLPAKYTIALVMGVVLLICATTFLLFKQFSKRWLNWGTKVAASVILLLMLAGSGLGYYMLRSGMTLLGNITNSDNAVDINTNQAFNVFISGIDSYGDISVRSRSDVNIMATVNPKTHKILLTTVPRDSYVKIPGGGNDQYDKLAHAGNYGVEASMGAVANLLGQKIDVYVRINFTSFIKSVDLLGGVTVNNPTAFSSGGHHFKAGKIHLNGEQALAYSRERKSLAGGDIDRGENQQRVIQGIIDKASEIRSINGFNALLAMLGESVETNMSEQAIKNLIRQQLSSGTPWKTEGHTLKGHGEVGTRQSYAMPDAQLYMYILDENSVKEAIERIERVRSEE